MKLSASFDFENANRSASIDRSSDDEPTRGRRDQKPAIRAECHATASQIGHLLLVKNLSGTDIDQEHGSSSVDSNSD
ncbi:MAG: hypothetical protein ABSF28_07040 [Terracidiphilus sp.]|jgi:hypothetical protein